MPHHAARRGISAIFFVFGALVGGWLPHIPDIQHALGLSNRVTGLALLGSAIGAVVSMPFVGHLIHRFGSRHVSVAGALGACLAMPWVVWQPSLAGLILNLFILGLCYGVLDVGMNAHSVAVQEGHDRPILSAIHGWFSLGGFAGSGGAALAELLKVAPKPHMLIASAVLIAVTFGAMPALLPADTDKGGAEGPKIVVPRGMLLLLGVMSLCGFVSEGGILDWCAVYLRNGLGATPEVGSIGVGVSSFGMAVGRFVGDSAVHRFGHVKILAWSGLMLAGGIWLGVNVPYPSMAIAGFAIATFGIANVVPILFYAAGTLPDVNPGAGLAAVMTCAYCGFLGGPPIIGFIADKRSLGFAIGLLGLMGLFVTANSKRAIARNPSL
ncbi:MAG TPA: MFS transporter [Fimbriimonas sp.]|nr:MFS transporter [Fimbriimonas sp.]